jgi:hypothetical protein
MEIAVDVFNNVTVDVSVNGSGLQPSGDLSHASKYGHL